jgi:hypothetical protein
MNGIAELPEITVLVGLTWRSMMARAERQKRAKLHSGKRSRRITRTADSSRPSRG